jgi:hypothetical protein
MLDSRADIPPEILPEQELLGLALADPRCMERVAAEPPGLFRDPLHRRMLMAARDLTEPGQPVNIENLCKALAGDPGLAKVGSDYPRLVVGSAPTDRNIARALERVRSAIFSPTEGRTAYRLLRVDAASGLVAGDYLIKGIWAPGEVSAVYGEPGSGKTFLAARLAYAVPGGGSVFGRRVRPSPVVYAALEGQLGFQRRMFALQTKFGAAQGFHWIDQPVDLFSATDNAFGLVDAILLAQAKLIVIDTLARSFAGGSENESADMGRVLAAVDLIRRETSAHVCLVHHAGKDSARGMRGHSSLLGAVDVALEVKRDGQSRSFRVAKSKDGRDGDEHAFALEVVELGLDDDGDPITTCIVTEEGVPAPATRLSGWNKLAFDLLVRALNEAGEAAPIGPDFPRTKQVVRLGVWRDFFARGAAASADNPDTIARTFRRTVTSLKNLNRINTWEDFVWLP